MQSRNHKISWFLAAQGSLVILCVRFRKLLSGYGGRGIGRLFAICKKETIYFFIFSVCVKDSSRSTPACK